MIETQGLLAFMLVVAMLVGVVILTIMEIHAEAVRDRRQADQLRDEILADDSRPKMDRDWQWPERSQDD